MTVRPLVRCLILVMMAKLVGLNRYPYFEIEAGDRIEVFINGKSRMVSVSSRSSRFYGLILLDSVSVVDDDKLLF